MASCRFRIPLRRHTAAQPGRAPPLPEIMSTLQRPALRRTAATQPIRASFFDDSNDARNSPEAMQLREKLTTSYSNTPFRGPAFQLPSGAVVVEDMWAASLNTTIDEIPTRASTASRNLLTKLTESLVGSGNGSNTRLDWRA